MKKSGRIIALLLCIAMALTVAGCSKSKKKKNQAPVDDSKLTNFTLNDDGSFTVLYEEEFNESYYDKKELETLIDSEISEFNSTLAADKNKGMSKESFKIEGGNAKLVLKFNSVADYMSYESNYVSSNRNAVLFIGKYKDAVAAGYTMAGKFLAANGKDTFDKNTLVADDNTYVLYTNQGYNIEVPGEILAISHRSTINTKTSQVRTPDLRENYIIFKK